MYQENILQYVEYYLLLYTVLWLWSQSQHDTFAKTASVASHVILLLMPSHTIKPLTNMMSSTPALDDVFEYLEMAGKLEVKDRIEAATKARYSEDDDGVSVDDLKFVWML